MIQDHTYRRVGVRLSAIFVASATLGSPGFDGQPAVSLYIATLEMNVLNCRSECDTCVALQVSGSGGRRYWHAAGVIGRYEKTVIDCPDPRALAKFYCQVLGMRVNEDIDGWVVIGSEPGLRELAFQQVTEWVPPRWPDPAYPQQLHVDIRVDDADQAGQELRALGATRAPGKSERGFRVFIDPVGHPFCIVFGRHSAG